ncbi:MAG: rhodanese-like domain-containing protein [Desulfobacteraceae bacterium]|nr:rhodanese-like domain-containing protein [Desulfobacteraceae bacterium]
MRKSRLIFFIWLVISLSAGADVSAGDDPGYSEISAPEVRYLLDGGKGMVIHVLTELEYNAQHITGSANIPVVKMKTTDKLPKDKDTPLVFYCMGTR